MQPNIFTIFTGDDKTMFCKAVYQENLDPFDLTSCSEIDVALRKADGTFAHLTLTAADVTIGTPTDLGKFSVKIGSAVSALLMVGEFQSFDVTFTTGVSNNKMTIRYNGALSVFQNPQ